MTLALPIGIAEPEVLIAGDTVVFTKSLDEGAPADGTLKFYFNKPDSAPPVQKGPVVATDNGDGTFLVTLAPAFTGTLVAGNWKWESYFYPNATTDRYRVGFGRMQVKSDYTAAAVDDREHVEIALANIEAVLQNKASQDQMSYSIHGRTLMRITFTELERFRKDYKRQLASIESREQREQGKHPRNAIKVRF